MTSSVVQKSSFVKKMVPEQSFSSFSDESTTPYQNQRVSYLSVSPQYYTCGTLILLPWYINSSSFVKSDNSKHGRCRLFQQSEYKPKCTSVAFILSFIRKGRVRWMQIKYPLSECTFQLTYSHTVQIHTLALTPQTQLLPFWFPRLTVNIASWLTILRY